MITVEIAGKGRVRLHNGHAKATGPMAAYLVKIARAAARAAGCAPEHGDPDYNAARLLIEEHGGKIISYDPTTIPGRVY